MRAFIVILCGALPLLGGCSSTQSALEASPETSTQTKKYAVGYQEVFRRIYNTGQRCIAINPRSPVVGQLYSDNAFGEITFSYANPISGAPNFFAVARIDKASDGSIVTVKAGGGFRKEPWFKRIFAWADGDENCY